MSTMEVLVARRRAYRLLGALLVHGVDEKRLGAVRAVPELAVHAPPDVSLDDLAAAHYALLGHALPPFVGVFLDEEGLVGRGHPAALLRSAHTVVGVTCAEDPGPDHLGQALLLLAVLVDAQIDALAHDDTADGRTLVGWQRRVLDEALLPWMPPLLAAVSAQPASLWTRTVELAIGLVAQHRHGDSALPQTAPSLAGSGDLETLLDRPGAGLRAVAEALTTAVRCGVYLTHRDLEALARRTELPRGFGGRRDTMEKLLRAAAEYDALPRLMGEVQRLLDARDDTYAALGHEPGLALHVAGWRRRLADARAMLERLAAAAASTG